MKITCKNPEAVVKRMYWLAYQGAGQAAGMGVFREISNATENDVWENVRTRGDYPYGSLESRKKEAGKPGDAYGDYVFGRMLKLRVEWDDESVTVRDDPPRRDYQAWCKKFPTYQALANAAIESVGQ